MGREGLTPEQRAANARLDEVIREAMDVHGFLGPDDGVVTDWIVVIAQEGFEDNGDVKSGYTTLYSRGSMANHKAVGLLHCGLRYIDLNDQAALRDDDGD